MARTESTLGQDDLVLAEMQRDFTDAAQLVLESEGADREGVALLLNMIAEHLGAARQGIEILARAASCAPGYTAEAHRHQQHH